MFQAENAWGWLKVNARNANHAEATMLFAWQDKMLTDMYFLRSAAPRNPYYYTERYINHASRITITLPDTTFESCTTAEHIALIQYYTATLPGFGRLWSSAVTKYATSHTVAECNAVGLHYDVADQVHVFASDAAHYSFYKEHFRSELWHSVDI